MPSRLAVPAMPTCCCARLAGGEPGVDGSDEALAELLVLDELLADRRDRVVRIVDRVSPASFRESIWVLLGRHGKWLCLGSLPLRAIV